MQNKDFFADTSIVAAQPTTALSCQPSQINAAMLYAAADKNTQQQLTKAALSDQCRALLAATAMENTLMLSAMEAHCTQVAPLGAHRFKAIADAYVIGTVKRIERWY